MSRIHSWKLSVTSWVDGMLAQIENHEAAVNAAISRVRQSTARARVQLKRVERDQRSLRDALSREENASQLWRHRAQQAREHGGHQVVGLHTLDRRGVALATAAAKHSQ